MPVRLPSVIRTCFAVVAIAMLAGVCAQTPPPAVISVKLGVSNVHAIRGERVVLVDAGSKGDLPALEKALSAAGIGWPDIAAVVVTHAHSDHAALAAEIRRRSGAQVVLGRGDLPMAAAGHNDDLKPTGFVAWLLKRFAIDPAYEGFAPDVIVDEALRLDRWGIAGRVVAMPGHTPGSLVVELDDGRTFVGDMILGGYLGGALASGSPQEHYFHADRARNVENIRTLLQGRTRVFHLGHGGPVTREAVAEALQAGTLSP